MTALQAEPGDARHQIEFCGPDVAVRAPEDRRFCAGVRMKADVVGNDLLPDWIEDVGPEVAGLGCEHRSRSARWKCSQIGHPQLDEESSTWDEVTCNVLEHGDLGILREHVADAVEHQVRQLEFAVYPRLVMSPSTTGICSSLTFVRSWSIIG